MSDKRYHEIDLIKCLSILTVVYIHSISTSLNPGNFLGHIANDVTRFAVPGLFFTSGFLFDKKRATTTHVLKTRLLRIVPPYIFCSLCLQLLNVPGLSVTVENINAKSLIYNLCLGNTFGIYYFLFVLIYLYAVSLVFRIIPDKWMLLIWGISGFLLFIFMKGYIFRNLSFFLLVRHPFFHLFSYLSGWVFSLYYKPARQWLNIHRLKVIYSGILLSSALVVWTRIDGSTFSSSYIIAQIYIYIIILSLLAVGPAPVALQPGVQFVSNCSYATYLLHFPIVRGCQMLYPELSETYSFTYAFLAWFAGVAGSFLLIYIFWKLSGRYSKYLIGC